MAKEIGKIYVMLKIMNGESYILGLFHSPNDALNSRPDKQFVYDDWSQHWIEKKECDFDSILIIEEYILDLE